MIDGSMWGWLSEQKCHNKACEGTECKEKKKKKTEKAWKSVSSSCVSAKYWPIKPLLLLLRWLSEKNYVVMKELNKLLAIKKLSRPPAKYYHFDEKKQTEIQSHVFNVFFIVLYCNLHLDDIHGFFCWIKRKILEKSCLLISVKGYQICLACAI